MAEELRQVVVCIPGSGMGLTPKVVSTILTVAAVGGGITTPLANCAAINLSGGQRTLMITVQLEYDPAAVAGARVHVLTAPVNQLAQYDNVDWDTWDMTFIAGEIIRQSHNYDTCPAFVRVMVENLDVAEDIVDVAVIATVGA